MQYYFICIKDLCITAMFLLHASFSVFSLTTSFSLVLPWNEKLNNSLLLRAEGESCVDLLDSTGTPN